MRSTQILAAAAALTGVAVAQKSTCTKDIKITEPTPSIDCEVVDANVEVDSDVSGSLVIDGPKQIKGDLKINNATGLISISSSSINSVEGLELNGLTGLNTLNMDSLRSIKNLKFVKLGSLNDITFGSEGVTEADSVEITDTDIRDLSGFKLATVKEFTLANNRRLNKFDSDLVNVTGLLYAEKNGNEGNPLEITMEKLEMTGRIDLRDIKSFKAPLLEKTEKVDFNNCDDMESLAFPNVTEIDGGLSIINNKKLSNVTFNKLKKIDGTLRIVNNTKLEEVKGFPVLESCSDINMGGNFEEIDFPKLDTVRGTSLVASTSENEKVCKFFEGRAKDDNIVAAKNECKYDKEDANEGGDSDGSGKSGSSGGSGDDDSAAGMISINSALLGLAFVAGVAQLF